MHARELEAGYAQLRAVERTALAMRRLWRLCLTLSCLTRSGQMPNQEIPLIPVGHTLDRIRPRPPPLHLRLQNCPRQVMRTTCAPRTTRFQPQRRAPCLMTLHQTPPKHLKVYVTLCIGSFLARMCVLDLFAGQFPFGSMHFSTARCRRYFTPKADGKLKCSPEALKLWGTPEGSDWPTVSQIYSTHTSESTCAKLTTQANKSSKCCGSTGPSKPWRFS